MTKLALLAVTAALAAPATATAHTTYVMTHKVTLKAQAQWLVPNRLCPNGGGRIHVDTKRYRVHPGYSEDSTLAYWRVNGHTVLYSYMQGFYNHTPYTVTIRTYCPVA